MSNDLMMVPTELGGKLKLYCTLCGRQMTYRGNPFRRLDPPLVIHSYECVDCPGSDRRTVHVDVTDHSTDVPLIPGSYLVKLRPERDDAFYRIEFNRDRQPSGDPVEALKFRLDQVLEDFGRLNPNGGPGGSECWAIACRVAEEVCRRKGLTEADRESLSRSSEVS